MSTLARPRDLYELRDPGFGELWFNCRKGLRTLPLLEASLLPPPTSPTPARGVGTGEM